MTKKIDLMQPSEIDSPGIGSPSSLKRKGTITGGGSIGAKDFLQL
jgi:hypothetical protein